MVGGLLLALMVGVLTLIAVEVRQWQTGRRLISRRRFVYRMIGGTLLFVLLGLMLYGLVFAGLGKPGGRPAMFLAFWGLCLLLGLSLVVLAIADLREVGRQQLARQEEIWRDFARGLAGDARRKSDPEQKTR